MNLAILRTLFIDGDGVLWHADKPMPRLAEFFDALHTRNIQWALLSNNAAPTKSEYVDKLRRMGVAAESHNVISSATVTAAILADKHPERGDIYVVGHDGLREALKQAGFKILDGDSKPVRALAVVASIDRTFSYAKIAVAASLIRGGALFIATNTDSTYPTPEGLMPGAGSIVAAIATAAGRTPLIMGKPEPHMFRVALAQSGADVSTTAMLGDRLETDIAGAKPLGLGTILVLSGVSRKEEIAASGITPDMIFDDIGGLADALHDL